MASLYLYLLFALCVDSVTGEKEPQRGYKPKWKNDGKPLKDEAVEFKEKTLIFAIKRKANLEFWFSACFKKW